MIQTYTRLRVADNSGAKVIRLINIPGSGKRKYAHVGDIIVCNVREAAPNSPVRNGPGTVGLPVVIGGVTVSSGDIVIGDIDGVVVVPHDDIDNVITNLTNISTAEAEMVAKVNDGLSTAPFISEFMASGQIEEAD